jgi:hypothetical protein
MNQLNCIKSFECDEMDESNDTHCTVGIYWRPMFMNNYIAYRGTATGVDVLLNIKETFHWKRAGEN